MKARDAGPELAAALDAARVGPGATSLPAVWHAFTRFATAPVEDVDATEDGDRLLFESGAAPDGEFELSFSRQLFRYNEAGENAGMAGTRLVVRFAHDAALNALPDAQVWGCGGPPWPDGFQAAKEFADEVEAHPAFRAATGREPVAIYQDAV